MNGTYHGVGRHYDGSYFGVRLGRLLDSGEYELLREPLGRRDAGRLMRFVQDSFGASFVKPNHNGAAWQIQWNHAVSDADVAQYERRKMEAVERIDIEPDARDLTPAEEHALWRERNRAHDLEMARR